MSPLLCAGFGSVSGAYRIVKYRGAINMLIRSGKMVTDRDEGVTYAP